MITNAPSDAHFYTIRQPINEEGVFTMLRMVLAVVVVASVSLEALASETITISCNDPEGWAFGFETSSTPQIEADQFVDVVFTYSWETDKPFAHVVTQSSKSAGLTPQTSQAAVLRSNTYLAFVIRYDRAIWTHTYFFRTKKMIISQHSDGRGLTSGSAAGKIFHADCHANF